MNLNASIGLKIAVLRKQHGMTQEQLAEKLDISIKHCSSVERGLSCLSLEKLIEVSNLFDISLDYLIKDETGISTGGAQDLPPSLIKIIQSGNQDEINLLNDYLNLYSKLRKPKS